MRYVLWCGDIWDRRDSWWKMKRQAPYFLKNPHGYMELCFLWMTFIFLKQSTWACENFTCLCVFFELLKSIMKPSTWVCGNSTCICVFSRSAENTKNLSIWACGISMWKIPHAYLFQFLAQKLPKICNKLWKHMQKLQNCEIYQIDDRKVT